jgi:hypothetical protein
MKTRKGVSEIVASMIVLVIVSVFGVMLYNISAGMITGKQNDLFSELKFESEKAQERFEIIGVELVVDSPQLVQIKLHLLNFSKDNTLNVTIKDVYVNNLRILSDPPTKLTLGKNSVVELLVTLPVELVLNNDYTILVISGRGVGNAYTWNYS